MQLQMLRVREKFAQQFSVRLDLASALLRHEPPSHEDVEADGELQAAGGAREHVGATQRLHVHRGLGVEV